MRSRSLKTRWPPEGRGIPVNNSVAVVGINRRARRERPTRKVLTGKKPDGKVDRKRERGGHGPNLATHRSKIRSASDHGNKMRFVMTKAKLAIQEGYLNRAGMRASLSQGHKEWEAEFGKRHQRESHHKIEKVVRAGKGRKRPGAFGRRHSRNLRRSCSSSINLGETRGSP